MTERASADKLKRRLSLSKSKKKAGIPANAAVTTTPITAFFSGRPPPKLACPLCGQFVPRFKINEHIDLQCKKFERGDSHAASASDSVVPGIQLSPRRTPTKSPHLCPNVEEEEVKETKTSPYFKKNSFHQTSRKVNSKSVVRMIDLGSLSAKLSRKCQKMSERTQAGDKHAQSYPDKEICSEMLTSSQKENLVIENLEDQINCGTVADLTTTSVETSKAAEHLSCSEAERNLKDSASKSETVQKPVTPKLHTSSKVAKRKKEMTSTGIDRGSGFRKKAKYKGERSSEPEEVLSSKSIAEMTDADQPETEVPVSTTTSSLAINSDSLLESGVESATDDRAVKGSHPPQLPYYLQSFRTVLQAVLDNEDDRVLFDQQDMSHIHAFEKLSGMLEYCSVSYLNT